MDKRYLTVRVTQDDITKGTRHNPWQCALALACVRASGKHASVYVTRLALSIAIDRKSSIYRLSRRARAFVVAYDKSKRLVEPSTFRLAREY